MFSIFKSRSVETTQQKLYGSVVAQARQPFLFDTFGVPDTMMGRFDMLALHVYLLARRLKREDDEVFDALNQDVFDLFVEDIERALRQVGIGDTTVPKRKRAMVHSFYGQIDDFDQSLDANERYTLLETVLARYFSETQHPKPDQLTDYIFRVEDFLKAIDAKSLLSAEISFPEFEVRSS